MQSGRNDGDRPPHYQRETERMRIMKQVWLAFAIACVALAGTARAQVPAATEQAAPPAAAAPAEPAAAPMMITDADVKGVPTPTPEEKAAGDPAGTLTGTAADI